MTKYKSALSHSVARTSVALPEPARRDFADKLLERVMQLAGDEASSQHLTVALLDRLILGAAEALSDDTTERARETQDPLQAARDRGRQYALAELQRPENLSLRDASTYAGRSDRAINEARLSGQLYALVPPGKQRGLRYPQWQFDAEASRLAAVLAPFIEASASCWIVHNFMQRPLDALGGERPMDWVLDAARPIETVVEAATARFAGEQGAA
ncbi:hypothetical protein [Cupriavidus metallidurans]|uniref:hypothetical protein n=1 Tax=Cupriavidus metallidurans TaxID=119219 RepID=UPI001F196D0A|nr:hypothetical protein [Cupriavidus metallidurans]